MSEGEPATEMDIQINGAQTPTRKHLLEKNKPASSTEAGRRIKINDRATADAYHKNVISNTKYNVVTFLPYNLCEQFGHPMNMYFLMIATLQLWSYVTPVSPVTT